MIRTQRETARLSLRRMSELAGISNPYLSQIERGLRKPSAEILQKIAKALRISAETLYVRAGILDDHRVPQSDLVSAIMADPDLDESARHVLVTVYLSLRGQIEDGHHGHHVEHSEHSDNVEYPDTSETAEGRHRHPGERKSD